MTGQEARDETCNCAPGVDGLIVHNSWAHPRDDEREGTPRPSLAVIEAQEHARRMAEEA